MGLAQFTAPTSRVAITLCGSTRMVTSTIHRLYQSGYMAITEWHQPQPLLASPSDRLMVLTYQRLQLQ